jgi:hypothetical protein
MMPEEGRQRSGSELVFGVLKTLMTAYELWGTGSGVELSELSGFFGTTDTRVGSVLLYLTGEGLVSLDRSAGTIRLSDDAARTLFGARER